MGGELAGSSLAEGKLFAGRWRVVRSIRSGGMGAVYEVVHRDTQARSALKVMLPDLVSSDELRARFRQEAMVTARIESDHIVKVFDGGADVETGAPYLVMELLRGEDLGTRVSTRGGLPAPQVLVLLRQVALALEKTHAAGIVHRDLKPENLFVVTRDDGSPCVKVLDFGIAKLIASASKAETTRTVGTPLYMAPEQVRGDGTIDAAADLYALGQIAFTLLTGRAYWAEERKEHGSVYPLLMAITAGVAESASARARRHGMELPAGFDAWFTRATSSDADARFSGAAAMIEALAEALGEERLPLLPASRASSPPAERAHGPTLPTGTGLSRSTEPPARRSWWMAVPVVAVAALALGILGSRTAGETPVVALSTQATPTVAAPPAAAPQPEAQPVAATPASTGAVAEPTLASPSARSEAPSKSEPSAPSSRPTQRATPRTTGRSAPPPPAPAPSAAPRRTTDPSDQYAGEGH